MISEVARTIPSSTIGVLAGMARDSRQDIRSLMFGNRAERIETVESIGKGILITAALGVAGRMMGLVIDSILEAKASGELAALFRYEGDAAVKRASPLTITKIRGSVGRGESAVQETAQLNRFHQAAKNLSEEGQRNIRSLRGWAKSKGWEKLPNPNGGPEKWVGLNRHGKLEVKLIIKPEGSLRADLDPISSQPRFDSRLESGGKSYINPFTGQVGGKEIGGHIWLENPFLSYQQQLEFVESGISYEPQRRGL